MSDNLQNTTRLEKGKAIGAQKGLADTFNEIVDVLNRLEVDTPLKLDKLPFGKWILGLESAVNQQEAQEINYINKLKKRTVGETTAIWIYAPSGVPSLFYWGESGSIGPVASGAVEWRTAAYVDSSLERDGDWVNTGLGQVSSIYAYIDSGVVKFSADVPADGESQDYSTPVTPYVWIGKMDWEENKVVNIVVGAVGLSSGVKHDATLECND